MTDPFSFGELSTLHMRMGWGSRVVSSWCFCMKLWFMNMSQLMMDCVTCHTCHGCMTDFRPILGNPVEVTHMTSPGTVYISHAKGTYFPLARISSMIPL